MIPKKKNALFVLIFSVVSYAVLTAASAPTCLSANTFNASLNEEAREGTEKGYAISDLPLSTANPYPANTTLAAVQTIAPGSSSCAAPTRASVKKVVIDAGHGGKDPGGMGANSQEKRIALRIAQLLSIGIQTNFPDVEVIMTRNDDTFIPLYERAAIANKAGADLFISIHANIMPGSSATRGTETFVMGQHVAKHNLNVAKRENASILLEGGDVKANYGYDPNSDEGHIMMSMFQHAFLERSITFAELVEKEFGRAGRKSRGVKQAGFVVLKETTMPAVLVETGFMSSPTEEKYLLSAAGQRTLANALLKAFSSYYELQGGSVPLAATAQQRSLNDLSHNPAVPDRVERAATPSQAGFSWNTPPAAPSAGSAKTSVFGKEIDLSASPAPARQRQWTAKGVADNPINYQAKPQVYHYVPPVPTSRSTTPAPAGRSHQPQGNGTRPSVLRRQVNAPPAAFNNRVIPNAQARPVAYGVPLATSPNAATAADSLPGRYTFRNTPDSKAAPRAKPKGIDLKQLPDHRFVYAVQIAATKKEQDLLDARFRAIPYPIVHLREKNLNKYQVRELATAAQAKRAKQQIKNVGFFDAMIVVYLDGKRLGAPQVRYLLQR